MFTKNNIYLLIIICLLLSILILEEGAKATGNDEYRIVTRSENQVRWVLEDHGVLERQDTYMVITTVLILPYGGESETHFENTDQGQGGFIWREGTLLSQAEITRLNKGWSILVKVGYEKRVNPLTLAALWYLEPISHFAFKNPYNGEGAYQLYWRVKIEKSLYFPPGDITLEEFERQARLAADWLQRGAANQLTFSMSPFDDIVVDAIYAYNGRGYKSANDSPYIVGMDGDPRHYNMSKIGGGTMQHYGYLPLIRILSDWYVRGEKGETS